MKRLAVVLLLAGCSGPALQYEICDNGKDDNANGLIDCEDPSCAGPPACPYTDGGYWGTCTHCGETCTKQSDCFGANVLDDRPIPQCADAGTKLKCQIFNQSVQLRIEYQTPAWTPVQPGVLAVVTTRWLKKTAIDGSAVTCSTLSAESSTTDSSAVEKSGKFNLLGFDSTKGPTGSVPNPLIIPYVFTGSGSDYLLYSETWSGTYDSSTHLPMGMRRTVNCLETGADVAPVSLADDCRGDGGTCRTLRPTLPAP